MRLFSLSFVDGVVGDGYRSGDWWRHALMIGGVLGDRSSKSCLVRLQLSGRPLRQPRGVLDKRATLNTLV